MANYRIVKLTLVNEEEVYVIQKEMRFFWIGPKIWETYQDIYDGNWCSHIGWTWFTRLGDYFLSLESANEELEELIEHDKHTITKIKYKEIVSKQKSSIKCCFFIIYGYKYIFVKMLVLYNQV